MQTRSVNKLEGQNTGKRCFCVMSLPSLGVTEIMKIISKDIYIEDASDISIDAWYSCILKAAKY